MERERKKVMVAINESEESYYALLWALDNLHEILVSRQLVIFASLDFAKSVQEIEKKVANGLLEKAKSVCTRRGRRFKRREMLKWPYVMQ